jgi:allantoin racemase
MRIHIVNPNTTRSMTDKIARAATAVADRETTILVTQPDSGPASIEGYYDAALAVPGMLRRIADAEAEAVDAHVIACFDDTGLDAARALATAPVIGIGEAGFYVASLICEKFAVVTTVEPSVPAIEHNLVRYGLASRCACVRATGLAVLSLQDANSQAYQRIAAEIESVKRHEGAEAIVLGCAGMVGLAAALSKQCGLPVIDGVAAAVTLAQALVRLGLKTSKLGGYMSPLPKAISVLPRKLASRARVPRKP